jgi:ParB/RepB/Spo0J family partition protein
MEFHSSYQFRCTYCREVIPWKIDNNELGLAPEEEPQGGRLYPYDGCYCGWGRFVVCEAGASRAETGTLEASSEGLEETRARIEGARYLKIAVSQIQPNPHQPRRFFNQETLRSLAESIKQIGLLEDVLVRPKGDHYELVLGERRWRACQLAGIERISAKVVDLSDDEAKKIGLVENLQREDLTEVEEAFAFKGYLESGMQQKEVGRYLGRMEDRVAKRLRVLSSHYYTQYQEQRIRDLSEEIERLREQLQSRKGRDGYESHIVSSEELVGYLNEGYDVVLTLGEDRIVVRRKL